MNVLWRPNRSVIVALEIVVLQRFSWISDEAEVIYLLHVQLDDLINLAPCIF